jgi:tetratricopeptide (TPR) repeat protein
VASNPGEIGAWITKAFLLEQLKQPEEAIRCFDQALRLAPKNGLVWRDKVQALMRMGRHELALESCAKLQENDPHDPESYGLRGNILMHLGRWEDAAAAFDEALRCVSPSSPTLPLFIWSKGLAVMKMKRFAEAILYYDQVLALCAKAMSAPQNPIPQLGTVPPKLLMTNTWYEKGACLVCLRRVHEALPCFEQAAHLGHPEALGKVAAVRQIIQQLGGR